MRFRQHGSTRRTTPRFTAAARPARRIAIAVAAIVALSGAALAAGDQRAEAQTSAAHLSTVRSAGASYSKTTVINKKVTKNYNNLSKQLSSCTVGTNGARCSSSVNRSFTNTWQTAFGMSAKTLAANLGFSYAASTGYSTTCQSPVMKKGQSWRMYPRGTRATYKIRQLNATQFRTTTKTSNSLASFKADRNSIYCVIR